MALIQILILSKKIFDRFDDDIQTQIYTQKTFFWMFAYVVENSLYVSDLLGLKVWNRGNLL